MPAPKLLKHRAEVARLIEHNPTLAHALDEPAEDDDSWKPAT
jgi:hypothetical protein